jgi:PEP-CTERM motif-containing protein
MRGGAVKKALFWFAALAVAMLGFAGASRADGTSDDGEDPARLFVSSTSCAPGVCTLLANHTLNALGHNSMTVTFAEVHGDPQWPALNGGPVLLILAIPNVGGSFVPPPTTLSEGTGELGGPNVFPSNTAKWNSNGFAGFYTAAFTSPRGSSVFTFIGLINSASPSDTFSSMSSADVKLNSITAGGFGIFVYELTGTGLQGGGSLAIDFSSPLPTGTFAFAYGCSSLVGGKLGQCPGRNTFATPWTQAGLVVPEPTSLLLLGSGLLAAGALRKKKQRIDD